MVEWMDQTSWYDEGIYLEGKRQLVLAGIERI